MEQKSNGALVGSIIIIIILVLGGLYIWKNTVREKIQENNTNSIAPGEPNGGTSADISATENELNNIDLENLDSGI